MNGSPVCVPGTAGWDPDMRALTVLALTSLRAPRGSLPAGETAMLASRPSEAMVRLAERQRQVSLLANPPLALRGAACCKPAARRLHHQTLVCMRLSAVAGQVFNALNSIGAAPLIIKGMALSTLAYGNPFERGAGDIDILVSPEKSRAAVTELIRLGGPVRAGSPVGDSARSRRSFNHATTVGNERRVSVDIGGLSVDTLDPLHATLLSACHAGKDGWPTLRCAVDLARLLRIVHQGGEGGELAGLARTCRVDGRLTLGIEVIRPMLAGESSQDIADLPAVDRIVAQQIATLIWRRLARAEDVRASRALSARAFRHACAQLSTGHLDAALWHLGVEIGEWVERQLSGDAFDGRPRAPKMAGGR